MKIEDIRTIINDKINELNKILDSIKTYDRDVNIIDCSFTSFCKILGTMNAQKKSLIIEDFMNKKLNLKRISPSENRGDAYKDNEYIEYKFSTTNESKNLNLRQIRNWQNITGYIVGYIDYNDTDNSIIMYLTKSEMDKEIKSIGYPSHGTKESNKNNKHIEYSITININSNMMKEWRKKYEYDELYRRIK